jgi:hypothetical protein
MMGSVNTWRRSGAALAAVSCLVLSACGDGAAEPSTSTTTLDVTVRGDTVEPRAKEIALGVGDRLLVRVHADRAGELHVHSSPERSLEFGSGTRTFRLTLDKPGQVDVEEHESDTLVARLVVE